MLEEIKEAFKEFTFLSPKDIVQLAGILRLKHLAKGEHLVQYNQYNYLGVKVIKGLLSHYVIDNNGEERTLLFVPERMFSGSMQTTLNGKPADENIIALENSILLTADMRELNKLAENNIKILKLINQSYQNIIIESAERINFLIAHSPEERYLHFCKTYPHLEQRIKQKDLASYLGSDIIFANESESRQKMTIQPIH
jgi:CRP-like cAMP-binding protein